jgi:hypothetical protein
MKTKKKKPNPGSSEAQKHGCTCPIDDNNHGKGSMWGDDKFWIDFDCPMHGKRK